MKLYYPIARLEPQRNDIFHNKKWTYDSAESLETAQKVFFYWANDYHDRRIIHAWVDVYEGGKKVDEIEYYKDWDACCRADELEAKWAEEAGRRATAEAGASSPV